VTKVSGWLLAATLAVANPLLHKAVSDVADAVSARWGFALYNRAMLAAIPAACALAAIPLIVRRRRRFAHGNVLTGVLAVGLVTLAAQRWLLVANIELIHLPQFALIAAILLAGGMGSTSAYVAATVAGIVDEAYQYFVVYAGRTDTYFDINDIVLDAIGAIWAVALLGEQDPRRDDADRVAASRALESRGQTNTSRWLVGLTAVLAVAWWVDPPVFSPPFRPTAGGRSFYRVLSTVEGVAIVLALLGLTRRLRRDGRSASHTRSAVQTAPSSMLVVALVVAAGIPCRRAPAEHRHPYRATRRRSHSSRHSSRRSGAVLRWRSSTMHGLLRSSRPGSRWRVRRARAAATPPPIDAPSTLRRGTA
jgi:hypothetical protein